MNPYVGEIRVFGFNFAPQGWAICQGQLLSISQNTALFSLLGTQFGGDGRSTFALPNLQGQSVVGSGQGPSRSQYGVGQSAGTSTVTLDQSTMPSHNHSFNVNTGAGTVATSTGNQLSKATTGKTRPISAKVYSTNAPNTVLAPATLGVSGGGQPHNNMQPYLTLIYCIAMQGVFPQRP